MLVRVHGEAVGRGDRSRYGGRANPRHFDRDARLGAGGKVPEQSAQRQRDAGLAAIARVPGHDGPHKYSGHARYRAWLLMMAGTPTTR